MKRNIMAMFVLVAVTASASMQAVYYSGGYNEVTTAMVGGDESLNGMAYNSMHPSTKYMYAGAYSSGGIGLLYNFGGLDYTKTYVHNTNTVYNGVTYRNVGVSIYLHYYIAARADGGLDKIYSTDAEFDSDSLTVEENWLDTNVVFNGVTHRSTVAPDSSTHYLVVALASGGITYYLSYDNGSSWSGGPDYAVFTNTVYAGIAFNSDKVASGGDYDGGHYYFCAREDGGVDAIASVNTGWADFSIVETNVWPTTTITDTYSGMAYNSRHPSVNTFYMGAISDPLVPSNPGTIGGIGHVSGDVFELVLNNVTNPAVYRPGTSVDLTSGVWTNVAHSTSSGGTFYETNLSYSVDTGSNLVIYVESTNPDAFFRIEEDN